MGRNKPPMKRSKQNPAIAKAKLAKSLETELQNARIEGLDFGIASMKIMSYSVLMDKMGFSEDDCVKFRQHMESLAESLNGEYLSLKDVLETCNNESPKIKLSMKDIKVIDPDFNGFDDAGAPEDISSMLSSKQIK